MEMAQWFDQIIYHFSAVFGMNLFAIGIIAAAVLLVVFKLTRDMMKAGISCAFILFVVIIANEMGFLNLW